MKQRKKIVPYFHKPNILRLQGETGTLQLEDMQI